MHDTIIEYATRKYTRPTLRFVHLPMFVHTIMAWYVLLYYVGHV